MVNSYTFASSRIKLKNLDPVINKRKIFCIPYTGRKNNIFIKKSQKYSFLTLNAQFSTGMHMNREISKWEIQK